MPSRHSLTDVKLWNSRDGWIIFLEHKMQILLKIHEEVESNSVPHCYVFISKSNSSKLIFSLEHAGVTLSIQRKQIWGRRKCYFQTFSIEVLQFNICTHVWLPVWYHDCLRHSKFQSLVCSHNTQEFLFLSALANLCSSTRSKVYWIMQALWSWYFILTS